MFRLEKKLPTLEGLQVDDISATSSLLSWVESSSGSEFERIEDYSVTVENVNDRDDTFVYSVTGNFLVQDFLSLDCHCRFYQRKMIQIAFF